MVQNKQFKTKTLKKKKKMPRKIHMKQKKTN